jgi:hypothetical protein
VTTSVVDSQQAFAIDGADDLFVLSDGLFFRKHAGAWTTSSVLQLSGASYPTLTVDAAGALHAGFYVIGTRQFDYVDYPASVVYARLK